MLCSAALYQWKTTNVIATLQKKKIIVFFSSIKQLSMLSQAAATTVTPPRCHYLFKSGGRGHLSTTQRAQEEHGPRGRIHSEAWEQI